MAKNNSTGKDTFSPEKLKEILQGVRNLQSEDLSQVFGGLDSGVAEYIKEIKKAKTGTRNRHEIN